MYAIVLIALLIALLCMLGMAKWTSPFLTDIRNNLGHSIVFSIWKGRPYMRAYVVPANPKTAKQNARRDINRQAVLKWQDYVGVIPERKSEWAQKSLSRKISGFNLFMLYAGKIKVASETPCVQDDDIDITDTIPVDLSEMALFRLDVANGIIEMCGKGELTAGVDQVFTDTTDPVAGVYRYFIGPYDIYDNLVSPHDIAAMCSHWTADETNGVALPAVTTVTV